MTVTPPGIGPVLADLADLVALSLPTGGLDLPSAARPVDQIAWAPPPTVEALQDLATTGLQQLRSLLSTLQRLVENGAAEPAPLGHLARAIGDAAHWIGAGYDGLSLKPEPGRLDITQGWQMVAQDALHEASDLLSRTEQRLDASPQPILSNNPELLWALSQFVGAQHQISNALGKLAARPSAAGRIGGTVRGRGGADVPAAIVVLGLLLVPTLYAAADGRWSVVAGLGAAAVGMALALARRRTPP